MKKTNLVRMSKNDLVDMVIEAYYLISAECKNTEELVEQMRAKARIVMILRRQTKSWLIAKMVAVLEVKPHRDEIIAQIKIPPRKWGKIKRRFNDEVVVYEGMVCV